MDEPVRPDPEAAPDEAGPSAGVEGSGTVAVPDAGAGPAHDAPRASGPRRMPPLSPRAVVVIVGALVLATVLYMGRDAIRPFVVGLVVAYLLDIPVERMARVGLPRWVSVLIVYAIFAVLFVLAIRAVFRPLADEIATFIDEFPTFIAQVTDLYQHLDLPPGLREAIDDWLMNLDEGVGGSTPVTCCRW